MTPRPVASRRLLVPTARPGFRRRARVSMARNLVGLALLAMLAWTYYLTRKGQIASYKIGSGSMEPALRVGEVWLMEPAGAPGYRVGDVIVFQNPKEPSHTVVKRIVAIGPAKVETRHGALYVDGTPCPPPTGKDEPIEEPDHAWGIQPGEAFVAGDNRAVSEDSRAYGPIRLANVKGVLSRRLEAAKPGGL